MKRLPVVPALVIWASLGDAGLSFANAIVAPVTIYDSMGQPWTMSTTDPRVTTLSDTTNRTGLPFNSQTTNVLKMAEFNAITPINIPIKITFTEDFFAENQSYGGAAKNPNVRSGLNFNLQNVIFNFSGVAWNGFAETLTDRDLFQQGALITDATVPTSFGDGGIHPANAHFHPIAGTNPPTRNPPPWDLANDPDGANLVLYRRPPNQLAPGQEFDFNIKIHDIVVVDFQRRFDLLEIPSVPEPATLLLVLAGLLGYGWRRQRRTWSGCVKLRRQRSGSGRS